MSILIRAKGCTTSGTLTSTISAATRGARLPDGGAPVLVACNFTPVPRRGYRVGAPAAGRWREILNTDAEAYGGSGLGNMRGATAAADPAHGLPASLELTLPPLAAIALQVER